MRFNDQDPHIEIGGGGPDTLMASPVVAFDWRPAAGNSYEWWRRDGFWDEEQITEGSRPSRAAGTVEFQGASPALSINAPPSYFRFDGTGWTDTMESVSRLDPDAMSWPWRWEPGEGVLYPGLGLEIGHNAVRWYGKDRAEEWGSTLEGGFRATEHGYWELRGTQSYIADGRGGNDVLVGGTEDSILLGGDGDDVLVSGLGGTVMRGGAGADLFMFGAGSGLDIVPDYEAGADALWFEGRDVSELMAGAVTLAGNAWIDLGDGHSLLLMGVTAEALWASSL